MKVTPTLIAVTLCASAVSAFGFQGHAANVAKKVSGGSAGPFATGNKAMVQPIDLSGNRMSSSGSIALKSEAAAGGDAAKVRGGAIAALSGIDVPLMLYFLFWYVGNYYVSALDFRE
eukprot:scaffold712016_cov55-Attheya_sp.AAC.1